MKSLFAELHAPLCTCGSFELPLQTCTHAYMHDVSPSGPPTLIITEIATQCLSDAEDPKTANNTCTLCRQRLHPAFTFRARELQVVGGGGGGIWSRITFSETVRSVASLFLSRCETQDVQGL